MQGTEITAYQNPASAEHAPSRRAVRLCSATTVLEEALDHGRWSIEVTLPADAAGVLTVGSTP